MALFKNVSDQPCAMEVLRFVDVKNVSVKFPCAPGGTVEIPDEYVALVPSHAPQLQPVKGDVAAVQAPAKK